MSTEIPVPRLFRPRDRVALRRLALDTADRGDPAGPAWPDRELLADLITRYYTDDEPQSLWVAGQGDLAGYLTGCLDTQRYVRRMFWPRTPLAVAASLIRGGLFHRQTGALLAALLRGIRHGANYRTTDFLASFPAHLHINLRPDARGRGIGRSLLGRFLDQARAAGVDGVHAATRADNAPARRFFEAAGFRPVAKRRMPDPGGDHDIVVYALAL